MVDRFREWLDDVEYKIKDAFSKQTQQNSNTDKLTPDHITLENQISVTEEPGGSSDIFQVSSSVSSSDLTPLSLPRVVLSRPDSPSLPSISSRGTTKELLVKCGEIQLRLVNLSETDSTPRCGSQITVIETPPTPEEIKQNESNTESQHSEDNLGSQNDLSAKDQESTENSEEPHKLPNHHGDPGKGHSLDKGQVHNITEKKKKSVSVQVEEQNHNKPSLSLSRQEKITNKSFESFKVPDIYKKSLSSPCVTLLKNNMSGSPRASLVDPDQTSRTLQNLSYTASPPRSPDLRQRRNRSELDKTASTESEEEVLRRMTSSFNITRGDQSHTEEPDHVTESRDQYKPLGTTHKLLDHSFSEDSPIPVSQNFTSKILRTLRRSTSDVLAWGGAGQDNHDAENDPSLSVDVLNAQAQLGDPVIPTIKCDIAIRVAAKCTPEILAWFIKELVGAGLVVTSEVGCSGDHFVKVTANEALFLKGAETMELLKRVHPEKGDGMKPFHRNEVSLFCPRQSTDGFLSAAERQHILLDCVNRIRTEEQMKIGNIKFYQHESIVSGLITNNIIKQIYPLHQRSKQNVLNRSWVWNITGAQPLNLIRHYFGDEIAIYFAWLGFYTIILIVPLIVGFAIGLFYDDDHVESADYCFTFYAFFNVVWPTIFLELWKRRSAALAWEWGTLGRDIDTQETQRPQFHGLLGNNAVSGEVELQYPDFKRQVKQVVSLLISLVCLLVVLVSMLAIFRFDDYVQFKCKSNQFHEKIPTFLTRFVKYTPKILLPLTVGILDVTYSKLAVTLNDWENYKHQRTYENWLVLKLIMFKFVNSFLALFYIAFYLQDFDKLHETLATLLITKQIIGNCGEILGPTVTSWFKVYLLRRNISQENQNEKKKLSQVETESEKPRYDSSFDDYLEMFIQMGYVILFSAAYPLAAVWAFLNNVVEIRGDAFKLVNGVQRPFIKRVEDIGFWQDAFEVLSIISIVVNCSLIGIRGQVGRWFPDFTAGQQILFIIVMEHIFLSIRFIISKAIPDIPAWVQLASAKERYRRDQALKGLEKFMRTVQLKGQVQRKVGEVRERMGEVKDEVVEDNVQSESDTNMNIKMTSRYKL